MYASAFEQISALQLRLKASQNEVRDFKSGAKYAQMQEQHHKDVHRLERRIQKREQLIAGLRLQVVKNRNMWFEQTEILEKEHVKEIQKLQKQFCF